MNGHDFTLEQNTEARMMLAVARRGLTAAINDAENGIGHLSCDDPKIMEHRLSGRSACSRDVSPCSRPASAPTG